MVPCVGFSEIAAFTKINPEADIGLHLTVTSEQTAQRWRPLTSRAQVPSLVDAEGCFHDGWGSATPIDPREVEIELRAQIEQAYWAGLRPTHLDSHRFLLQSRGRDLFEIYLGLGREYQVPVLVARTRFARFPLSSGPADRA
jgi:chitin disaccharide deacetylase